MHSAFSRLVTKFSMFDISWSFRSPGLIVDRKTRLVIASKAIGDKEISRMQLALSRNFCKQKLNVVHSS